MQLWLSISKIFSVKIRSNILPYLWVCLVTWCSKPNATINFIRLAVFSSFSLLMWRLKSPTIRRLVSHATTSVMQLVNFVRNSTGQPAGGLYIPKIVMEVCISCTYHFANWNVLNSALLSNFTLKSFFVISASLPPLLFSLMGWC